ncbi:UDP-N-acetylglucosamine transferase subunit ALG14 isoform 1-T1 [Trichechus inunguis]
MAGALILAALGGGTVAVFIALRLWVVFHHQVVPRESLSLLVVAGSGGHTTEILRLLGNLSNAYSPRHYIFADTDEMSAHKIRSFELDRAERYSSTVYTTDRIPRSREVRQSWLSTVLTTLYSMLYSFPLTFRLKPDLNFNQKKTEPTAVDSILTHSESIGQTRTAPLDFQGCNLYGTRLPHLSPTESLNSPVLCNGPGTCVPICLSALLLGILGIKKVIIVYVESVCRVETLSLSGKILYYLSDYFVVQWPTLKEKYPKSVYLGRIV